MIVNAEEQLGNVRKTLQLLVKSEQEVLIRCQSMHTVEVEEVRAGHRLDAFQTALGLFEDTAGNWARGEM